MITQYEKLRLLSVSQAAKILAVRDEYIKSLINEGKIKVLVTGSRTKIPYYELERFIELNLTSPRALTNNNFKIGITNEKHPKKNRGIDGSKILEGILGGINGNCN